MTPLNPSGRRAARPRRLVAFGAAVALSLTLAGCGSKQSNILDEYSGEKGLDAVSITGDQGQEPKVEWKDALHADKVESKTLVEGKGKQIKAGDSVYVDLWIGNGFSKTTGFSSYPDAPQQLTAGADLGEVFGAIVNGQRVGSRVAVVVDPKEAVTSQIGPQFGIGDGDSALVIGDIVGTLLTEPEGKPSQPAAWAPTVVEKDKVPSALDFAKAPKPTAALASTTLIEGTGDPVKNGDSVTVNYLGQVYKGKEPFDASYPKGEPFTFTLNKEGGVVPGWIKGLQGVPVGSRIILAIPPKLGYGEQGNPQGGIKGTDTMYFVIDVLGAV